MATKKTIKSKKAASKKAPAKKPAAKKTAAKTPKEKVAVKPAGPRHPKGRVTEKHGGKEALAKALAPSLIRGDEDAGSVADRLKIASNAQLLHLQQVVDTVKQKWGSRDKLIAAIGDASKKSKDKDYLAKLATFSLPQLVDLARSSARA